MIVGSNNYNSATGRAYIFYGGYVMDNIADITFSGKETSSNFGVSVSSAGDVNGDGYSDVIVGQITILQGTGKASIFFGGINMDTTADLVLTEETLYSQFGISASTAGDVNGDGYSDVIVGASRYSSSTGRAYIYFGGINMDSLADVTLTGESINSVFGGVFCSAGDMNGDGYSDVIVGARGYNDNSGRAYIFFGGVLMDNIADIILKGELTNNTYFGNSVSTAGDFNGDGYSDVIVGEYGYSNNLGRVYIYFGGISIDSVADIIITGKLLNERFGRRVSTAGDVNGDGYSEVIIVTLDFSTNSGRAIIFYGDETKNLDEYLILNNNNLGMPATVAGDVNGDGYSDVILGASGKAYLYVNLNPLPELNYPINNSISNPVDIIFKWNKINTSTYYELVVSTDSIFQNIVIRDTITSDTSKLIIGLEKNKKYYWLINLKDSSGANHHSLIWNFKTIPPLYTNVKLLFEGMYSPDFNLLKRTDSLKIYLRNTTPPFELIDSATGTIDSISFSNYFNFYNAPSGNYFIVVKHFNCIETWSKSGGEILNANGSIYNYDFTTSISQSYGDNLKLKGSKYCLYSGDVNQDGYIDLSDVVPINNDALIFLSGNYINTDLTADGIVDLTDLALGYNNSANFIRIRQP